MEGGVFVDCLFVVIGEMGDYVFIFVVIVVVGVFWF